MQIRCKHEERIENKETFPSPWEMMSEAERERVKPLPWMFRKKVAVTFICQRCGRRRVQESQSMEGLS